MVWWAEMVVIRSLLQDYAYYETAQLQKELQAQLSSPPLPAMPSAPPLQLPSQVPHSNGSPYQHQIPNRRQAYPHV